VRVLGPVDRTHAALADELLDPVSARNDLTDQTPGVGARRSFSGDAFAHDPMLTRVSGSEHARVSASTTDNQLPLISSTS